MKISVVVPAHNEAQNIPHVLTALVAQDAPDARLVEIVVIASGCTDDTVELARRIASASSGVRVHVQDDRAGKAAAINDYLRIRDTSAEVVVLCSADLIPAPGVLQQIATYLRDNPKAGMVGVRPVPNNDPSTMMGRVVCLLWELHHCVALRRPKMGELVAFRADLVQRVSELSVVDEASVEDIIRSRGYEIAYLPDAVVTNRGPESWGEYFEQRRRIARGHYWLDFAFGYKVATLDRGLLFTAVQEVASRQDGFGKVALGAAIAIEVAARAAGFWDARVLGGKHRTWAPLPSTKRVTHEPVRKSSRPAEGENSDAGARARNG